MMKKFDYKDILQAYRKLKNYVYYDNTSIFIRKQIAEFEAREDFTSALSELTEFLNNSGVKSKYFQGLLKQVKYNIIPKKISVDDKETDVISNKFEYREYFVEKVTFLIDAPIEIHIISVLWIMNNGYNLQKKYFFNNYAYSLVKEKPDYENDDVLIPLFKPYFRQYQKWRDKAIKKAKKALDDKYDVLLLGLDIKDYYHSVDISFEQLKKDLNNEDSESNDLTDLLKIIHETYSNRLPERTGKTILPIGLLSSGILANWYIKAIDKQIVEKIKPAYYGRYVDDLLLLIINPVKPKENGNNQDVFNNVISNYFVRNGILKRGKTNKEFFFKFFPNLELQKSKIVIYKFEKNSTHALLDNFFKTIKKNSSEFRFLPEDDAVSTEFDEEANQILYSGSINKLRSVIRFQQDKYSASKFLAKKIFTSLLSETEKDDKTVAQIEKFFKGKINLECISLWEKIFIYFIVNNLENNIVKFLKLTLKIIDKVLYGSPKNNTELGKYIENTLRESLFKYLIISLATALSLEPKIFQRIKKNVEKELFKHPIYDNYRIEYLIKKIRISNLVKHNYVFHPLLNYTIESSNMETSFIQRNILSDYPVALSFELNEKAVRFSPRSIGYYESCVFAVNKFLYSLKNSKGETGLNTISILNEANLIYERINKYKLPDNILLRESYIGGDDCIDKRINIDEISVTNSESAGKFRVAIANTIVDKKNQEASMQKKPNLDVKRKRSIISLLNDVTESMVKLFVLPENYTPYSWLDFLATYSKDKEIALVAGIEHVIVNNTAYNIIATILPFKDIKGFKDAILSIRLKNHYAPLEEFELKNKYRYNIPKNDPYLYNLFSWLGVKFSVFYCYELTNIYHRAIFRSKVDLLVASEYNKDIEYFSNIVEATVRDIHCYFMQVNSTDFGDSRITQPKGSYLMNLIRIKGGINNTFLVEELDIKGLRDFQKQNITYQLYSREKDPNTYKMTPPDFDYDAPNER